MNDLFGDAEISTAMISNDEQYRYNLTRTWDPREPRCLFIMLNPSTADSYDDDPTIRRCKGFARREGCGGLSVVNLYALRSTDPSALGRHPDPVGPENDWAISEAARDAVLRIAAWGARPPGLGTAYHDARVAHVVGLVENLACLGHTKGGAPRHPLYLPGDAHLRNYT